MGLIPRLDAQALTRRGVPCGKINVPALYTPPPFPYVALLRRTRVPLPSSRGVLLTPVWVNNQQGVT
jgi:hypothetical protein